MLSSSFSRRGLRPAASFSPFSYFALFCSFVSLVHSQLLGSNFGSFNIPATYDYIIVGGGQAGLVLAERLTEDKSSVAVIEAGSFYEITNGNFSSIPGYATTYNAKSPSDTSPGADWGYTTIPQTTLDGNITHYPRGKMLGGSSARNTMAYERGTRQSYDMWAEQVGDPSWSYDAIDKYFRKSLNFTPPDQSKRLANATPSYDEISLGKGGLLDVTYANYAYAIATWLRSGLQAIGINPINGFTSGSLIGSSYIIATVNHTTGERASSETNFLRPALGRPNLQIYVQTLAKKILFNGTTATGVLVDSQGYKYTLSASKEVILAAGAFGSPQLLMVSGIGPADTLKSLNIPVIVDKPGVGQNLWDHIIVGPSYRVNVETSSSLAYGDALLQADQKFLVNQTGILSSPGGDFGGYEKIPADLRANFSAETLTALAGFPSDWPEAEYLSSPGYLGYQWNYLTGSPHDGYQYATLSMTVLTPTSRGNMSISSNDTSDQPLINPNWLATESDEQVAVAAYKRVRQVWDSQAMQGVVIGSEAFPGRDVSSDADILQVIKETLNTLCHAVGTNKMGTCDDPLAVVDPKGNVYGTQNLRVADSSVFPLLPPGLPMGTVYMLAEKLADDIRGRSS